MRRRRVRPPLLVAMGLLGVLLVVVAAWGLDSRGHRGQVFPRATLADKSVRGMDREELAAWVRTTAERFATASVEVRTPGEQGGGLEATVPELGVAIDEQRTVTDALAAGRTGTLPGQVWRWLRSHVRPSELPIAIQVDRTTLDRVVAERDRSRTPPTEPDLEVKGDRLDGVAGKNGRGVDPARLARALRRAEPTSGTLVVSLGITPIPPRFTEADADRLAAQAEEIARAGLQVGAGSTSTAIPAESLRGWLRAVPGDESLQLALREDAPVAERLAELLPDAGTRPVDAGFTVSGGRVSITPPRAGTACCAPGAGGLIDAALRDPAKRAKVIDLPLRSVPAARDEEAARKLNIVEQVSTFTTPHAAGEPRVKNIQLMADTVRGTVVPPGGVFSINETVGMRTREKGYVEAPVISGDYKFEADVGGGVSQFATTMFNAAFFAGLDIPTYAMHGLYISRYPYGREATLSFPAPDLRVRNVTPHGILIWTSYTDTSITVTLYSTKFVTSSEQTGQQRVEREAAPPADAPKDPPPPSPGPCVSVTTERTRVYLDGRTATDRFFALYAPAEGWSCPNRG